LGPIVTVVSSPKWSQTNKFNADISSADAPDGDLAALGESGHAREHDENANVGQERSTQEYTDDLCVEDVEIDENP
jgi:hypothetical protein